MKKIFIYMLFVFFILSLIVCSENSNSNLENDVENSCEAEVSDTTTEHEVHPNEDSLHLEPAHNEMPTPHPASTPVVAPNYEPEKEVVTPVETTKPIVDSTPAPTITPEPVVTTTPEPVITPAPSVTESPNHEVVIPTPTPVITLAPEPEPSKPVEVIQESVLEEIARRPGMIGRLTIPAVGVNVALFHTYIYNSSQAIVDNQDSAAYIEAISSGCTQNLIADHNNHGFEAMKKSIPNQTIAYIDYGNYTEKYICVNNFVGTNLKTDLQDEAGNSILYQNAGGLAMYTCNAEQSKITVTYWQPVN